MTSHAEAAHAHDHHGPPIANQSSRVDPRTLGMLLFIGSEIMLFGSFFAAYFFVRVVNPSAPDHWPPEPYHFPVFVAGVNTAILVTSSFTMHWALQSIKRGERAGFLAGMVLTFVMGLAFLLTQVIEYLNVGFNTGDGAFASVFFGLTGLHGAHVAVGLSLLLNGDHSRLPRPLFAGAPPRRRAAGHLLALRRRDVDRRVRDRLPHLSRMESPFRSEDAAFKFLLITIGAFALIVVAAWISSALGFLAFIALSVTAVWMYLRQRPPAPERVGIEQVGDPGERRVLVVANETVAGEELLSTISTLALSQRTSFLVVCPALNSRLKTWTSDEDPARAAAQKRLGDTLERLASVGIDARGEVGDGDPLVAIDDAVRTFSPGEIVISTHPPGRSNWLEHGVVDSVRARYDVPVTHVVVDLEAQALEAQGRRLRR